MNPRPLLLAFALLFAPAQSAPQSELGLLIPRSALVQRLEREEAFGLLIAYGAAADSYAAGVAAGRAQVYRDLLALLDGFPAPK